jgi:two-component system phosphate regulon sensor histidine kinase PhoR
LSSLPHLRLAAAAATAALAPVAVYAAADSPVLALATAALGLTGLGAAYALLVALPARRIAAAMARFPEVAGLPEAGDLQVLFAAFTDMSARVRAAQEGSEAERNRLLAALNSSTDPVVAIDSDARVAFANAAAERQLSRPGGLVGSPLSWVLADERVLRSLRRGEGERRPEAIAIDRPGRRHFEVIVTPIVGGRDWTHLLVFHDVTDVKRVEMVRRDFVANVSHELRTPISAIKAVLETLADGAIDDAEAAHRFLSQADAEVDRLAAMVEELLELSRIESGELPLPREPLDAGEVVTAAAERLRARAAREGLRFDVQVGEGLPPLLGDARRLEQAVVNLLDNAVKFTPPGGLVRVLVRGEEGGVVIEVSDTGAGISAEDLPRVFERFYKADRSRAGGGSGLGLALVRHTVEAHGGSVTAESRPGEGSLFRISLPSASPDDQRPP